MINIAKGSLQRVLPGSPSLGGRKPGNIFLKACDLQGSRGFKSLSRRLVFGENVILERPVVGTWPYSVMSGSLHTPTSSSSILHDQFILLQSLQSLGELLLVVGANKVPLFGRKQVVNHYL